MQPKPHSNDMDTELMFKLWLGSTYGYCCDDPMPIPMDRRVHAHWAGSTTELDYRCENCGTYKTLVMD